MASFFDYLYCAKTLVNAVLEDVVLPKLYPPTSKPCYDDDDWSDVDDSFPTATKVSDDEWVHVPPADVELASM